MRFESQVVHIGDRKRNGTGPVPSTTPIHLGTTFFYESAAHLDRVFGGEEPGVSYARYGSPTNDALEELVTKLEGGHGALATASGMAALQIALQAALVDRPKSIVSSRSIYGATVKLLDVVFGDLGVDVTYVDACDLAAVAQAIEKNKPGVVFTETISNPLMRVPRLRSLADLAHSAGAALVVDSTFSPPMMLRPFEHGADIVVHSATKYLAGHGDVLGGLVISDEAHFGTIRTLSKITGPVLGPFEAYLTMRGIKTLALRFERQCANAQRVAEWLGSHPAVERVNYCGDPRHPDAAAITEQFVDGLHSGILSFEIKDANKDVVLAFMDRLQMVVPGTSLGDVHSLLLYPAMASHRDISPKQRERVGIRDSLVRIAVGIESADDIIADLEQALQQ